jgi:pyridoxine/pyridoxamine 5'-phosphate oxidase
LPWAWAEQRLTSSHDYWLATVWPDGRPHVMPVWGMWDLGALWFSSSLQSRKARNLAGNPQCTATTDNPYQPVVVSGIAETVTAGSDLEWLIRGINQKYETSYSVDFLDPAVNGSFRLSASWVFGLDEADFTGSPTRWTFRHQNEGP